MSERDNLKKEIFMYSYNNNIHENKVITFYDLYESFYYGMKNLENIEKYKAYIFKKFNFICKKNQLLFGINNIKECNKVFVEIHGSDLFINILYNYSCITTFKANAFNSNVEVYGSILSDEYVFALKKPINKLFKYLDIVARLNNYSANILNREFRKKKEINYVYDNLNINVIYDFLGNVESDIRFNDDKKNELLNLEDDSSNLKGYLDSHKVDIMRHIVVDKNTSDIFNYFYNKNENKRQQRIKK